MPKSAAGLTIHQYEAILQETSGLLYVIDLQGHLLYANRHLLALLGLKKLTTLKERFYRHLTTDTHWLAARVQLLEQADSDVIRTGEAQYAVLEPPVTDMRGVVFYYEATRIPLLDKAGKVSGLSVSLSDVTRQHLLEAQLPNAQAKRVVRPFPPSVHRDPNHPPKVLVVEDNALVQQSLKALLASLDCQVDLISTEKELDTCFAPGKYDFILMDIGLEGTSGYLLAKHVRQLEGDTGYRVPMIALTGFDADVVKTDCDYYFMEGAMSKPLDIEQARQMIQRYVYQLPLAIRGLKSLQS